MPAEAIEELKDVYNKTFGYWSDQNYETGDIARWVENAEAIAHVKVHDQLQDWPRIILGRNLVESIEIDNGPHSMTRVQLRCAADGGREGHATREARRGHRDPEVHRRRRASSWRCAASRRPLGELARQAFFEVMNPKATAESRARVAEGAQQNAGAPAGPCGAIPH